MVRIISWFRGLTAFVGFEASGSFDGSARFASIYDLEHCHGFVCTMLLIGKHLFVSSMVLMGLSVSFDCCNRLLIFVMFLVFQTFGVAF